MEKDGFFGNPAGFNWQSESHNTPLQVAASMGMNTNHSNIDNSSGSGNGKGKGNGNGIDPSQSSSSSSSILAATCCFLNLNWDQSSTDQTANFESALSSLVSSPSSSNPNPNLPSSDSIVIRELIGRLGSICNNSSSSSGGGGGGGAGGGDDISPPNSHYQSTNTSCYSTPLNSPPKLNSSIMDHHHPHFQLPHAGNHPHSHPHPHPHPHHPIPFAADPGFAERAARFSCFGPAARSLNYAQFGPSTLQEPGKLSRVSSSQSLKTMITNTSNGPQPQPRMGPMNVNGKETPMHLVLQLQQQQQQQEEEEDGIGIGVGTGGVGSGQLETEDMMMLMMMRSSSSAGEFGNNINNINAREESSASDRMAPSGSEGNVNVSVSVRKRKATTPSTNKGSIRTGKEAAAPVNTPQVAEEENSNSKRSKSAAEAETNANEVDKDAATGAVKTPMVEQKSSSNNSTESAQKQGKDKDNNAKPPELPKQDYIHVRARRGQATDSHSLAERVRREKISERMKFLQDLVPGCNKVTGKAVMLDEIINYVQSLQRQVEFLSMKLATVNPRIDFNVDSLLSKDMHQSRGVMVPSQSSYLVESTTTGFSYGSQLPAQGQGPPLQSLMATNGSLETQCSVKNLIDASSLRRSLSMQLPPLDGFTDAAASQLGAFWEDDLQSVVQMGFGQNSEAIFSSFNFQGPQPTSHMKIEL